MKLEELKRRGGYISSRSFMLDRKPGVALFSAKTEEKPSRHKNNRGEMVVIPALMVRDSSGKKVAVYHRLGAALEQNEKGEIRMIDCIPSNAKLFAPLKEFITPGEKFANIPEPAAAALRKFYGHEAGDKWKDSLREKRAAQAAQNAAGQPATTPTPPPEAAPSPAADNTINTTAADETAATEANTATGEASPTMEEAREPQPEVGSAEVALTPPVEATEVMSGNDTLSAAPIKLDEGRRRRRDNNRRHQQRGLAA